MEPLRGAGCSVVITSRPYGYDRSVLPFESLAEYELAPFTPRQRRLFISNWLSDNDTRRARVLDLLQSNSQFSDLASNALLLTLTCAIAERHDLSPDEMRRVDLYRLIVPDMVQGVWRDNPLDADDPRVSVITRLLRQIAWELFRVNPARTAFSDDELMDVIKQASGLASSEWLEQTMRDLRATGLLVSPASGRRMFLHRTFLEYLAAEHIAYQADPLTYIERFLWQPDRDGDIRWQPSAAEMLCLLAGCLNNPSPLLIRLLKEDKKHPDHFHTMLLLVGRALADIKETQIDETFFQTVARKTFRLWHQPPLGLHRNEVTLSLAYRQGVELVAQQAMNYEEWDLCHEAARTLEKIGSGRANEALIQCLQNSPDDFVRSQATKALATSGGESTILQLTHALNHPDEATRKWAIVALGEMESEQAVDALIERLANDTSVEVRKASVVALEKIRNDQALEVLIEQLCSSEDDEVRKAAALALGKIKNEKAIEALIMRMQHEVKIEVRWELERALYRGKVYRLPSEAEWERACRVDFNGDFFDDITTIAWCQENTVCKDSVRRTQPVGQKQSNSLKIYDMLGNVSEWCEDVWHGHYNGAPSDGSPWVGKGEEDKNIDRVVRGGSFNTSADNCRPAFRTHQKPDYPDSDIGFRVVVPAKCCKPLPYEARL